ncbi:MAG: YqgQ family protein [Lactovum sp.]
MKNLYDVQEWLKKYGYINLLSNRKEAIYFMKLEIAELYKAGIISEKDPNFFTANLILRQELRIENQKE